MSVYPGIADAIERLREAAHRDSATTISVRAQDLRNVLSAFALPHAGKVSGAETILREELRFYSSTEHGSLDGIPFKHVAHVLRVMLHRLSEAALSSQHAAAVPVTWRYDIQIRGSAEMTDQQFNAEVDALELRYMRGWIGLGDFRVAMVELYDRADREDHTGPDGEANYAWVYDEHNNLVCTAKTHHAIAIVQRASSPAPRRCRRAERERPD